MTRFGKKIYVMKQQNKTVNICLDLKWRSYVRKWREFVSQSDYNCEYGPSLKDQK